MGSIGEFEKGHTPFLERIKKHNDKYNDDVYDAAQCYRDRIYLDRALTIIGNLALENDRRWWEFWMPRWAIRDEHLRNDAKNLIEDCRNEVNRNL
jgi:hypothetical protein